MLVCLYNCPCTLNSQCQYSQMIKVLQLLCCLIAVSYGLPAEVYDDMESEQDIDTGEGTSSQAHLDGIVIVEGDIGLSKEQAAIYYSQGWKGLVNSQAWLISTENGKWGRNIPYVIDQSLRHRGVKKNLELSFGEIHNHTCVRFRKISHPRKEEPYMRFMDSSLPFDKNCRAVIGRPKIISGHYSQGTIILTKECAGSKKQKMTPAHEIMHAMGRYHEQTRSDRDDYITLTHYNTCKDSQFKKETFSYIPPGLGYDYFSIMHYAQRRVIGCTSSYNQPIFKIKQKLTPKQIKKIGQRDKLSSNDIMHINRMFCSERVVRLEGGEGPYEGRIEVNSDKGWGTVCSNGFDIKDARVFCSYLGYPGVEKIYTTDNNVKYMTAKSIPVWMSNLKCTGEEFSPFDCQQLQFGHHQCTHDQDIAIKCSKAARLVGDSGNSGRLELYGRGEWGSVCSHKFGYKEAKVACGMMGYSRPVRAVESASTTENKIIISGLKCDGTEDHLSSCDYHLDECINNSPIHLTCN